MPEHDCVQEEAIKELKQDFNDKLKDIRIEFNDKIRELKQDFKDDLMELKNDIKNVEKSINKLLFAGLSLVITFAANLLFMILKQ